MKKLYSTKVTAKGARNGVVKSEDGLIDMELRMPKELGGEGGAYTNPEQLFAAGYSACFDGALNLIAKNKKIEVGETEVIATVSFGQTEDNGFGIGVDLEVKVPGVDKATAEKLVEQAHMVCPYSKATKGNIPVTLKIVE